LYDHIHGFPAITCSHGEVTTLFQRGGYIFPYLVFIINYDNHFLHLYALLEPEAFKGFPLKAGLEAEFNPKMQKMQKAKIET